MTHLAEELDIATRPDAVWRVVSDTKRWPQFYATPREVGKLTSVEYLDGAAQDALDVRRRMHFLGVPSWDEQITRWRPGEAVTWMGVRNPWQKHWQQQMELIPGSGTTAGRGVAEFTTLKWDVFYKLSAPRPIRKVFKRRLEDIMMSSLRRVERLALEEAKRSP